MNSSLNRETLRLEVRLWSDRQRRLAIERVIEQLPDTLLAQLLGGLAHVDRHRVQADMPAPFLHARVEVHVAATRGGEFRGELVERNAWGDREPWQTAAWLAATSHLFELLLDEARQESSAEAQAGLRDLAALIGEVDKRCDELVVFEEEGAREQLGRELDQAARFLARVQPTNEGDR